MIALNISLIALAVSQANSLEPILIERPNLDIVIRREFYGVTGRNYRDAHNAVMTRQVSWGGAADARPSLNYSLNWMPTDTGCEVTGFFVSLEVVITYPLWREFESRSRRQRQQWDEMFSDMQIHENIHADIAAQGAVRLRNNLAELEEAPSCPELEAGAEALAEESEDWTSRNQYEYDRLSRHGIEQENVADWQPHEEAVGRDAN